MKILCTGGSGLVGKELGKALVAKGHRLVLLSRQPEQSRSRCPFPHEAKYWDALGGEPEAKLWEGVEGVIHLAGENIAAKRWTASFKERLYNTRVHGTRNLVRAIQKYVPHLKFFISTSAAGYYPASKTPMKETEAAGSSFLSKLCMDWEEPVLKELPRSIRSLIFRLGVVFSKEGGALQEMALPIKKTFGVRLGSGKQLLNWIDIEDIVAAYCWAVDSGEEGVFNVASPKAVSNEKLTECIAAHLSKKTFGSIPPFLARIVLGEIAEVLMADQSMSMEKLMERGFSFRCTNVEDSIRKNLR